MVMLPPNTQAYQTPVYKSFRALNISQEYFPRQRSGENSNMFQELSPEYTYKIILSKAGDFNPFHSPFE